MQVANTFAATTTPAGVGGLALSTRFLQKGGLGALRATAAVALQQTVQVITHVALLIFFSAAAGASADLSHFVPLATVLYLIAGCGCSVSSARSCSCPSCGAGWRRRCGRGSRRCSATSPSWPANPSASASSCSAVRQQLSAWHWRCGPASRRSAATPSFVTVTVVTMVGGTLASAAPTPGGVGAVEAALIGGLAAFGVPAAIAVPSVLLYRVLTCWLPVFIGWPIMRWLTDKDMI